MKNKNTKKEYALVAGVVVAVVVVLAGIVMLNKKDVQVVSEQPQTIQKERRLIDGVFVLPEQVDPPIAGVMIENMVVAQPISGIADARLVFESITEANITRFLAYFILPPSPSPNPALAESSSPSGRGEGEGAIEIGPIRSARPYYLDFAAAFNTLYVHVGSAPAAYELLRKVGVKGVWDLDQWYNSQYFWRSAKHSSPHNVYTSIELLKKAYATILGSSAPVVVGAELPRLNGWQFKNDVSPDLRGNVEDIKIGYNAPYSVQWLYDKSENQYKRIQWGGAHKDAQGKEIIVKNIAVAFQKMEILDSIGRKNFTTLGEGEGLVFQDGRVVVGTWKKPTAQEMSRWYDAQGNEIKFNAGITWVEIVPEGWKVDY